MTDCLFCKIIDGKMDAKKLGESDSCLAIADIMPQAPLHALIVPKKHVASLNEMSAADRREVLPQLFDLADRLAAEQGLRERGYRTVINNQREGGQAVFHLHLHLLAGAQMRGQIGAK